MRVELIFDDWRRNGVSVYNTEDGVVLSSGDLHSGTVLNAEIVFDDSEIAQEIIEAGNRYNAYPVFSLMIPKKIKQNESYNQTRQTS